MTFPAYSEYKDSGVEWLGKIPIHWDVDRLKASILSCRNGIWGDEAKGDANDIACIRVADFDRQKFEVKLDEPTIRNVGEKERSTRILNKGDLLLEKSGGGEKQPVGCVVLYTDASPAICSNFIAKIELAADMDSSFWRYVHAAAYSVRLNVGSINQTSGIQNLDQDRYFNERAAYPPLIEQHSISNFLDYETAKIDCLIKEQEQLIELLNEKRQSIISNAVCRGLAPNVPMKDSGVAWLGMVPKHWKVIKTKSITTRISSGKTPSGGAEVYVDDGVIFIRSQNVHDDGLMLDDVVKIPYAIDDSMANTRVKVGDILLNITGASIGRSCVIPVDFPNANVNQHVCVIRLRDSQLIPYVGLFYKSIIIKNQIDFAQNGAAREGLNFEQIGELLLCMPPIEEQSDITKYVHGQLIKFSELILEANSTIKILTERRAALISAAVTGKIDVRGFK